MAPGEVTTVLAKLEELSGKLDAHIKDHEKFQETLTPAIEFLNNATGFKKVMATLGFYFMWVLGAIVGLAEIKHYIFPR